MALLLSVSLGAQAMDEITLHVVENAADPTPELDLQLDVVVPDHITPSTFSIDLIHNGAISNVARFSWGPMAVIQSDPSGYTLWVNSESPPAPAGSRFGLVTFTLTGATGLIDVSAQAEDEGGGGIPVTVFPYSDGTFHTTRLVQTQNAAPQLFQDGAVHSLSLGTTGTELAIHTGGPATLAVFFTAVCSVGAAGDVTTVLIDLDVGGVLVPPTDGALSLCTSLSEDDPSQALAHPVGSSADGLVMVGPGAHPLRVDVRLFNYSPGDSFRIEDLTLVVMVREPIGGTP